MTVLQWWTCISNQLPWSTMEIMRDYCVTLCKFVSLNNDSTQAGVYHSVNETTVIRLIRYNGWIFSPSFFPPDPQPPPTTTNRTLASFSPCFRFIWYFTASATAIRYAAIKKRNIIIRIINYKAIKLYNADLSKFILFALMITNKNSKLWGNLAQLVARWASYRRLVSKGRYGIRNRLPFFFSLNKKNINVTMSQSAMSNLVLGRF